MHCIVIAMTTVKLETYHQMIVTEMFNTHYSVNICKQRYIYVYLPSRSIWTITYLIEMMTFRNNSVNALAAMCPCFVSNTPIIIHIDHYFLFTVAIRSSPSILKAKCQVPFNYQLIHICVLWINNWFNANSYLESVKIEELPEEL